MRYHALAVLSILSAASFSDLATPPLPPWGDLSVKHTWNTPRRDSALIDALHEVSTPGHQRHVVLTTAPLILEQVAELIAPRQDTLKLVHSWLEHHRLTSCLSASYQLYRHTGENATEVILRTVSYSLPAVLHAHVQTVAPTTYFAPPRKATADIAAPVSVLPRDDELVTPSIVRWLYRTQAYEPLAMGSNALGIFGLNDEYPSYTDLTQFMTEFRADAVNGGGFNPNQPGREANCGHPVHRGHGLPYSTYLLQHGWLAANCERPAGLQRRVPRVVQPTSLAQEDIPPTISISYSNPETIFPLEYASSLCNLFAQLGVRGVSVLVSSGDDGVGPWVTSVGGTERHDPEVGMYMSGGGFSMHFTRPDYQEDMVAPFLGSLGSQYAGLYDPRGRGIPDISAQANWCVFIHEARLSRRERHECVGARASFPPHLRQPASSSTQLMANGQIVAGIVSLLNDYLISTGRHRLGFLNLLLYGDGRIGIKDVTSGSNPGCGTDGFTAIPGWDPVRHRYGDT
ncbi:subtilisin-like protein [Lactarius hengduanensis]|nr:subtilisin-like protein [Lactarius hengduanensis]